MNILNQHLQRPPGYWGYTPVHPLQHHLGRLYRYYDGDVYMLSQVAAIDFRMVGTANGKRYSDDPVTSIPEGFTDVTEQYVLAKREEHALNPQAVAITTAYMWSPFAGKWATVGSTLGTGHVEFTSEIADWAVTAHRYIAKLAPTEYPGVFDYEVSEPFGQWLLNTLLANGSMPQEEVIDAYLKRIIAEFFAQLVPAGPGRDELTRVFIEKMRG